MNLQDFVGVGASGAAGLGLGALTTGFLALMVLITIWKLIWYGLALYRAIQLKEKVWFVVLFVCAFLLGDLGILAIIYLLIKKKKR
ncbi:hypothetical protein FJZ19_03685 [Candidatus Pacearchaeota archaeon]|nr:hypothetical protein [Candidatus Pacearchaeota archaeon]